MRVKIKSFSYHSGAPGPNRYLRASPGPLAKTKNEKKIRDILTEALIELVPAFTAPIYEVVAASSDRRE